MKLRLLHSFMVIGVIFLLVCYSAFLTAPGIITSAGESLENALEYERGSGDNGKSLGSIVQVPSSSNLIQGEVNQASGKLFDVEIDQTASAEPFRSTVSLKSKTIQNDNKKRDLQTEKQTVESIAVALPPQQTSPPKKSSSSIRPSKIKGRSTNDSNVAILTGDIYESGFSYPNPSLCTTNDEDGYEELKLFIMITSAPAHFSARDAIRLTWGHYGQRSDISIAFLIGRTNNLTILDGLEEEKRIYDDLIVGNFIDSYDNLTLKTMATLEWVNTYCQHSKFVLKTDDDMFINIPNLLNFIQSIKTKDEKESKIYGRLAKKWKPVRNKKSKYYVSLQQFKKTIYPDFTTGPAYLFSSRLAKSLFDKGLQFTYLKLEDVYTTGLVAGELKIKRIHIPDFANKKVNFHKTGYCALSRLISMHMVAFHEQFELWKKLLDGRTKCRIIQKPSSAGTQASSSGTASLTSASVTKTEAVSHNKSQSTDKASSSSVSAGSTTNTASSAGITSQ